MKRTRIRGDVLKRPHPRFHSQPRSNCAIHGRCMVRKIVYVLVQKIEFLNYLWA